MKLEGNKREKNKKVCIKRMCRKDTASKDKVESSVLKRAGNQQSERGEGPRFRAGYVLAKEEQFSLNQGQRFGSGQGLEKFSGSKGEKTGRR